MKTILEVIKKEFVGTILEVWYDKVSRTLTTTNLGDSWKCKMQITRVYCYDKQFVAETIPVDYSNLVANLLEGTIVKSGSWYSWTIDGVKYKTQNESEIPHINCGVLALNSLLLRHTCVDLI
jgi:hypothetical protein